MHTDAIIVGGELDALIAALRLLDQGASLRLLATGAGSLPYAAGGMALLGFHPGRSDDLVEDPWETLELLPSRHPLQLLGRHRIEQAFEWFVRLMHQLDGDWEVSKRNRSVIGMAGGLRPVVAKPRSQAALEDLTGRRVAVIGIEHIRDFPADLVLAGLRSHHVDGVLVRVDHSIGVSDSAQLGQAMDRPEASDPLLGAVRAALPAGIELALFPAILGFSDHRRIVERATDILGLPVLEAATMPPCLFGIRLQRALLGEIERRGGLMQPGMRGLRADIGDGRCKGICDGEGRQYHADRYIAGTGGVLMGGLDVDSRGHVTEPVFRLPVHQTDPLSARLSAEVIEALHMTGIETDTNFRPRASDGRLVENLQIVGTTLAHWNPCREGSLEGVSIATGWAAAEAAPVGG
jgi:glycerol-3-phosphate dehydrogenase subunit B